MDIPANKYMPKFTNTNTGKKCEICSKLTVKTPCYCSGVFIVNLGHILLTCSDISIANFDGLNIRWVYFEEISFFFNTLNLRKKLKAR